LFTTPPVRTHSHGGPTTAAALGLAALITSVASAQTTMATLQIGGPDTYGCQNGDNPPTLTGHVPASATFEFSYDQASHELKLVVTNTSEVVANSYTPLLTRMYFNLPPDAVSSIELVDQVGSGGAAPDFKLDSGSLSAACFGYFDVRISPDTSRLHGIANAAATQVGSGAVTGPVTFTMKLAGPGAGGIDATAIAHGFSSHAPSHTANGAAKFQAGGRKGCDSGYIGTGKECATSMYVLGEPKIGETIQFCQSGSKCCHDCLWISLDPGPTVIGGYVIPVGLPLVFSADFGRFGSKPTCLPLSIPNDPLLSGLSIYFAIATFRTGSMNVSFGNGYKLTIQ